MHLSQSDVQKRNAKHASEIKKLLSSFLQNATSAPASAQVAPSADADYYAGRDRMADILKLEEGETTKMVPIAEIMASADAQADAVVQTPWFCSVVSNREVATARHFLDNIDDLIKQVPLRCRSFSLLAVQRLAILTIVTPIPVAVSTRVTIDANAMRRLTDSGSRKQPFDVKYSMDAGATPCVTIADYCTGSGKTIIAIQAALSVLCNDARWEQMQRDYPNTLRLRLRESHSGLCRMDTLDSARLARAALIFVPASMLSHWFDTAQSAVFGVREVFGSHVDVVVWKGMGRGQSLQEVVNLQKPVIWVLPLEADSNKAVRAFPNIGFAIRVFDELNVAMRSRNEQPESVALQNIITQATIESLCTATCSMPRHPLRLALGDNFRPVHKVKLQMQSGNYKAVQVALDHYCKMSHFTCPTFIRKFVSEGVQRHMPSGIVIKKVNLRAGTLAAVATGSEMVRVSLSDLVLQMIGSVSMQTREQLAAFFKRANTLTTQDILKEIDVQHDAIVPVTLADSTAKSALRRLRERLLSLLEGQLPCCPITLESIPKDQIRILQCCTAVLDARSLEMCNGRCPLCRAPIDTVASIPDDEKEPEKVTGVKRKQSKLSFAAPETFASGEKEEDDEGPRNEGRSEDDSDDSDEEPEGPPVVESFDDAVARISSLRMYSIEGVTAVISAYVATNPTARILLCFSFQISQRRILDSIMERIRAEVHGAEIFDVERHARDYTKMDHALRVYGKKGANPHPVIFLINTGVSSASVCGLDLSGTDLTLVANRCSLPTQRQAVGRSLRMQKRLPGMGSRDTFPSKLIVVLEIAP